VEKPDDEIQGGEDEAEYKEGIHQFDPIDVLGRLKNPLNYKEWISNFGDGVQGIDFRKKKQKIISMT